jgi:GNAT superfamily N-acetyltransferase
LQHAIFPTEHGDNEIVSAVHGVFAPWIKQEDFWIAKSSDSQCVGIVGLYAFFDYPKDAWLDWFGVLPKYRREGMGKVILNFAKTQAKKNGFETLRLWTDDSDNRDAIEFYKKNGMQIEQYENPDDVHYQDGNTVILSISLTDKTLIHWSNKKIYLKEFYRDVLPNKKSP